MHLMLSKYTMEPVEKTSLLRFFSLQFISNGLIVLSGGQCWQIKPDSCWLSSPFSSGWRSTIRHSKLQGHL